MLVLQVSKQASTAYSVCEVWKQELSTLIAITAGLLPLGFLQTKQLINWSFFINPGLYLVSIHQMAPHERGHTSDNSLVLYRLPERMKG